MNKLLYVLVITYTDIVVRSDADGYAPAMSATTTHTDQTNDSCN